MGTKIYPFGPLLRDIIATRELQCVSQLENESKNFT